jgi:Ca2+-binding EF-hand superfamily protein
MPSFDGKSRVSITDFFNALASYGLIMSKEDSIILVKQLNRDVSDYLNFDEFLFSIRGRPNEERQAVIDLVYNKFDKNRTGYAEATELRKVFNCIKHPRLLMGEYTEDQIFYLYLKNFSNEVTGTVTKKVIKGEN